MRRFNLNILWGILLIVGGVLFLLQNLGLLGDAAGWFWALVSGAAGLTFLVAFAVSRERWWPLIPGFALLGVALAFVATTILPVSERLGGAAFLGMIGLGFWAVYLVRRDNWWAIIPGGVLLTLAAVAGLPEESPLEAGGLFFLGLALTFGLVYLLTRMTWALIPGAALLAAGAILVVGFGSAMNYVWPVALILVGAYLIVRVLRSARSP